MRIMSVAQRQMNRLIQVLERQGSTLHKKYGIKSAFVYSLHANAMRFNCECDAGGQAATLRTYISSMICVHYIASQHLEAPVEVAAMVSSDNVSNI